jgi:hypothetical protein
MKKIKKINRNYNPYKPVRTEKERKILSGRRFVLCYFLQNRTGVKAVLNIVFDAVTEKTYWLSMLY